VAGGAPLAGKPPEDLGRCLPGPRDGPEQDAVAGPGGAIERAEIRHPLRPQGIQVEGTHQLQEIGLFFDDDGVVAMLEEMAAPRVAAGEGAGVPREEAPHGAGQRTGAGPREAVGMIREERPGKDAERLLLGELREARDNVGPVDVILENDPAFETPHHHMVEGSGGIETRLSGHAERSRPQLAPLGRVP
jgi:hypothetical protein